MPAKPIRFSQHALEKFGLLADHGFSISEAVVIETVRYPDFVDHNYVPPIAQKVISDKLVLRVVFVEYDNEYLVITFYPGRRKRYED